MFVPELGQADGQIYKQLSVNDLLFKNRSEKQYEIGLDSSKYKFSLLRILRSLFFSTHKPVTVGGLLLCSS